MSELKTFFKIKESYEPYSEGYSLAHKMDYDSFKIFFSLDEVKAELTRLANSIDRNCEIPICSGYLFLDKEKGTVETEPINIEDFQENYFPDLFYVVKYRFYTDSDDGNTYQLKDKYSIVPKGINGKTRLANQYNLILEK